MKKISENKKYSANVATRKISMVKQNKTVKAKSLTRQYVTAENLCKVTFRLPKEAAQNAKTATVVGDFNNWDPTEHKMKKLKNGDFTLTLDLPCNREYSFRYLIDANRWEDDWFADKYVPHESDTDNSVLIT
jgi:1,4-alpha-glucan branching enzyme